jgi:hypothetical protein
MALSTDNQESNEFSDSTYITRAEHYLKIEDAINQTCRNMSNTYEGVLINRCEQLTRWQIGAVVCFLSGLAIGITVAHQVMGS